MQGLESNDYQDLQVIPGTTFSFIFQITPLDLTGASAIMRVQTLGDLPMTLSTAHVGANPYGKFALNEVVPGVTATWAPGTYEYVVLCTFADGTILPYGTGKILVVT